MIIILDTSRPDTVIELYDENINRKLTAKKWNAGRTLAKELLAVLKGLLEDNRLKFEDVTGIVFFKGPGSFTGLRIGATVANTIAYANKIPIVGEAGEDWANQGVSRLNKGSNDKMVLPEYGGEANITKPRK